MSSKYGVGDLVNVCVNVEYDAFDGLVMAIINLDGWWYQVEALNPVDMPGKFWFREKKIVKVYEKEAEKAEITSKPTGTRT